MICAKSASMCRDNCSILMLEPFGEVGANFSLQLSWRTQFAKIKKLMLKINVKNMKKIYFNLRQMPQRDHS